MWPLIAAFAGMVAAVPIDIVASRLGVGRLKAYGASLFGGLITTLIVSFFTAFPATGSAEEIGNAALAVLLYGAWWFIFLNIIQSFDSALRVQLLKIINDAGGRMSWVALQQLYNDRMILDMRLARLLEHGSVEERGGRLFVVSSQLKLLALFFRALKIMLLGRRSEFDLPTSRE